MSTRSHPGARSRVARVLLVDDEPLYAAAVEDRLRNADFDVQVAENGEQALSAFERERFDLVLLDVMLPGMGGLDVASRIREHSDVPIVVMSGHDDRERRLRAFDEGADDYIAKSTDFDEVLRRLTAVLRRSAPRDTITIRTPRGALSVDTTEVRIGRDVLPLTRTEFRILHALAVNHGNVVDVDALSLEVWGHETFGQANYIQSHISRLRKKLASAGIGDLVETVYDVGYVIR